MTVLNRKIIIMGLLLMATFWLGGCEVFVDLGLKNSTYELYDARIPDGFDGNALYLLMPGYVENDPAYRYMIHFYENDRCTGTYYAADTLNYEVEGTWTLPKHEVLRIDLDDYVDGDFLMIKLEPNIFYLSTDENYIDIIQPDTIPLNMYIKRTH